MRIKIYDYDGDYNDASIKTIIQLISCTIHKGADELTAEVYCDASAYYKGSIKLGDRMLLPYPMEIDEGQFFRITKIATEGEAMTIIGKHISFDFANAVCMRWQTSALRLQNYVRKLNDVIDVSNRVIWGTATAEDYAVYANNAFYNNRNITFDFYQHRSSSQYSTLHECGIGCMGGEGIINHIVTIYGCNVVRDGNKIVLTYGSASDYFRNKYGIPEYQPIYKAGRNVVGYTTEEGCEGYYSSIAAYTSVAASMESNDNVNFFCGIALPEDATDASYRYMLTKSYNTSVSKDDYDDYSSYLTACASDVMTQAREEINSFVWEGQNVSVETIAVADSILFGGEESYCADANTRTQFKLRIESFDLDCINRVYENIELGRVLPKLSNLKK